jgi:hypothetical protein
MIAFVHFALLALATSLTGAPAGAAGSATDVELKLDGRSSPHNLSKMMGEALEVSVKGDPGRRVTLLVDVRPGRESPDGRRLPLGFSPVWGRIPLGFTDSNGELTVSLNLPPDPALQGTSLYFVAVIGSSTAITKPVFSDTADLVLFDRNVDLAGNSRPVFPFFEHVTSFNQGATVELGIDPTRYPVIVGKTADIYVVASKTRVQWKADPTLVDVVGGPISFTFGGATIQANTVTVDTGTLSGNPGGPRLGVPYDLVIDLNRDGLLNSLDLIDGYSDVEAGLYVVHDLTQAGPFAVTELTYQLTEVPFTFNRQNTFYPSAIAGMGKLPLVVVSHGNGHNYQWYDHIGNHLASYGYVVMSHQNNTMPGTFTAAQSTLENTDWFLRRLPVIGGGVLAGHVDETRIVWLGHSRGAEGVVRAYDMLLTGAYVPLNFVPASIQLISSIAPVDFGGSLPPMGEPTTTPHDVNYHVWVGQADEDVNGCTSGAFPYQIHDRATGTRLAISLYGVGHSDFHNANTYPFARGPCLLGKAKAHAIELGYLLPLVEHFVYGSVPAKDYLWRDYSTFRPIGVPFETCTIANLMFQEGDQNRRMVIDDFQTNSSPALASSGAAVSMTVPVYDEGQLDDMNQEFTDDPTDPFNGFTMSSLHEGGFYALDDSRGSVFSVDGAGDYDITYSLTPEQRDMSGFEFLQFRAAQATRHPLTTAQLGDVSFTVTLRDGTGATSSIRIADLGAGIEEPYQRQVLLVCGPGGLCCDPPACVFVGTIFCGTGVGWNNDFETVRIRLPELLNNGNALDMTDIRDVIFRFGPTWGSAQGRIGLDEIELTNR